LYSPEADRLNFGEIPDRTFQSNERRSNWKVIHAWGTVDGIRFRKPTSVLGHGCRDVFFPYTDGHPCNSEKVILWEVLPMIQFVCESCGRVKESSEAWIVGLAAEAVGVTAARREVTIQSGWDRSTAVHPLAVHFCSVKCKDDYMAELFAPGTSAEKIIAGPAEIVVKQSGPEVSRVVTKRKRHSTRRKKRAA
jgi:hypothetical protein